MCAPAAYTRIVVHVRRDRNEPFQPAQFGVCLSDYFGINDDFGRLECEVRDSVVYLQPPDHSTVSSPRFQHPPFCVGHKMAATERATLPPETLQRGVDVGVCVVLESCDGALLVTRRAAHMRTFANVWVPPGGHMEEGETLEEAGLRELKEETGLDVGQLGRGGGAKCRLLGLWESFYPPVLYLGLPKRHHLVVYLYLKMDSLTSHQLQQHIKLDHGEVGASMWMTREVTQEVVYGPPLFPSPHHRQRLRHPDAAITEVDGAGVHSSGVLQEDTLRVKMPEPGQDLERFSTGTRYALKLWLNGVHLRQEGRKESGKVRLGHTRRSQHRPHLRKQSRPPSMAAQLN